MEFFTAPFLLQPLHDLLFPLCTRSFSKAIACGCLTASLASPHSFVLREREREGPRSSHCAGAISILSPAESSVLSQRQMDPLDLWLARMSAAKRNFPLHRNHSQQQQQQQQQHWDRFIIEDFDADDDTRTEFSCPYCYEDFDIATLCSHLEDEHLCESRGMVCPVCAAKVAKDLVGHIILQHGHSFKSQRRRRFRRTSIPLGATLSFINKDFKEAQLQALLGGFRSSNASSSNSTDSFLSAVMHCLPIADVEDPVKSNASSGHGTTKNDLPVQQCKYSIDASLSAEEREQNLKQATLHAMFIQQLLISTIMDSS